MRSTNKYVLFFMTGLFGGGGSDDKWTRVINECENGMHHLQTMHACDTCIVVVVINNTIVELQTVICIHLFCFNACF